MSTTSYWALRRQIAQRMNMWGGGNSNNNVGTFTANGDLTHVIDTNRAEPDSEWNDSWIVINPGGTNQALTTTWRRIARTNGYTVGNGTITLISPLPSTAYSASGVTYELYKGFRPEQWLGAANWALANGYPDRYRRVEFEVPEDYNTVYYDWEQIAAGQTVANPTTQPTISKVSAGTGVPTTSNFQPGTYTVSYTYYNAGGETTPSPSASVVIPNDGVTYVIQVEAITVPDNVLGVNYYVNPDPNGTQTVQYHIGASRLGPSAASTDTRGVTNASFQVPQIQLVGPPAISAPAPPPVNSTGYDVTDILNIQRRVNPRQYPEILVDLGANLWEPAGQTVIKLMYRPLGFYNLRFNCMATVPLFTGGETETTQEPLELLLAGSEYFLWDILLKQSTGQNTIAWDKLAKEMMDKYNKTKRRYAMQQPRQTVRRPRITPVWG